MGAKPFLDSEQRLFDLVKPLFAELSLDDGIQFPGDLDCPIHQAISFFGQDQ